MARIVVDDKELNELQKSSDLVMAVKEFSQLLMGRTQDLPHRFKCPASMRKYMETGWDTNSVYQHMPVTPGNNANCLYLRMINRPTQKILELEFDGADGMRLFTLELEYGE